MANKYDTVSVNISVDDIIRMIGNYEFKQKGILIKKL